MRTLRDIENLPDEALLSIPHFAELIGQATSTTWRKLGRAPGYPEPIKLGARCTRVRLGDVRRLLQQGAISTAEGVAK